MIGKQVLHPTGVDLSGHDGIVVIRLLHANGFVDVPLPRHHAVALAEALSDTTREMRPRRRKRA